MNPTAERTLGIRKCDVIGSLVNETGFDWDWEQVRGSLDECWANGGTVCLGRMCFSGSAGKTGVMDISINRTSAIGDDQAGLLLVGSDVSAYAVLEDQLQEHSRLEAIGQLTSGIAHEINTPVQYVGDNAQFVGECFDDIVALVGLCRKLLDSSGQGDGDPRLLKEMRQFLEDIDIDYMLSEVPAAIRQSLEGVRQISSIVGAMKEFVHPWGAEKNKVDLNGLIQSTITVARNEWKYVAEVETDFDSTLPPVMCMPGEINQVILNLIVNAVDAIGDVVSNGENGKGAIRISTKWDGDWVEIRVADTGAGIPEDVYGHIFEPFFTTKQCGKGSGQGLAISRRLIVENHQGTLDLESEVGKGTVCIIRLPVGHGDNDLDQELLGIIGDKR
ncbi:MAG: hypothetical protein JW936_08515 [Sedimentisphaerales bacterium]|nr:hypothetical protein [Sedimentisphaerales bacterium]